MGRILKAIFILVVLGLLGLVAFSYYPGSLAPPKAEVSRPVTLDVD